MLPNTLDQHLIPLVLAHFQRYARRNSRLDALVHYKKGPRSHPIESYHIEILANALKQTNYI
jgi:hypothetical protein